AAPAPQAEAPSIRVAKLRNGTVIDHLAAGTALRCLAILGLAPEAVVTVGLNLPSRSMKRKDLLKMENRRLTAAELARIALLAPRGTVCTIEDYRVVNKTRLELPTVIDGVVHCPNPSCITHHDPVVPRVRVDSNDPLRLRCHYCERRIRLDEVEFVPASSVPAIK
ncbi:MAG: aspartate carbamoyltransferase regulatory subunit, partial [Planctomycetaceae bacterium]|nr:aspartate carbamoyltransferase regulatory subunit [Planctomycetaceae bacterium]